MTQYMQEAGAMKQLTDDEIDAIAKAQDDDEQWFTRQLTKMEWRDFARAILAAALAPAAVQAWQPIETAPKDLLWSSTGHNYGERILVYNPVHREVVRCRWWWSDSGPSNFIADGGLAVFPSHWMPIPAPPIAANEGTLTAGKQGGDGVAPTRGGEQ